MSLTQQVFFITFSIIFLGFLLKYFSVVSENDGKTLSKIMMHSTFPAVMVLSGLRVNFEYSLIYIPLICLGFAFISILVVWILAKSYTKPLKGIMLLGAAGLNVGLFGFPILEDLFGEESLKYAILFDMGNTLVVFGILYPLGDVFAENSSHNKTFLSITKKVFSSPPVVALLLGIFLNIFHFEIPIPIKELLNVLAKANKTIVLLLMGIYMSFNLNKADSMLVFKVLSVRFLLGLALSIALFYFYPYQNVVIRNTITLCLILPLGMTILPFSDEYNFNSRIAGALLNFSIIISLILMWLMVFILEIK